MSKLRICLILLFSFPLSSKISCRAAAINENLYDSFWQITDVHWDLRYSRTGNENSMCHEKVNSSFHEDNGVFGNYYCDAPRLLVLSSIRAMKHIEPHPKFVIWSGDNAPHSHDPAPDFEVIFKTISNLTEELRNTFSKEIPIIPVLGNHDSFPQDQFPFEDRNFYSNFLEKSLWKKLIPEEQHSNFLKGGYFQMTISQNLSVIVLNSMLYFRSNKMGNGSEDPGGQLKWLRGRLKDAMESGYRVLIVSHSPPGFFERFISVPYFNQSYNDAYVDLMNEYGESILGHTFGHEHTDSFRLFSTSHDDSGTKSVGFIAPSVTPWHPKHDSRGTSINPSLRLYFYNETMLLDYHQYMMNLTEANAIGAPEDQECVTEECFQTFDSLWKLLYKASAAYGLSSLDGGSMLGLFKRMTLEDSVFQKYYFYNSVGFANGYCNDTCKVSHICSISHLKIEALYHCLNDSGAHLRDHSINSHNHNFVTAKAEDNYPHTMIGVSVAIISLVIILSIMLVIVVVQRRKILGAGTPVSEFEWVNRHSGYRPLNVDGD